MHRVAAREETGYRGLPGDGVHHQVAVAVPLDLQALQEVQHSLLADGRDDGVGGQDHLATFHGHRPGPTRGVPLTQPHAGAGESCHPAAF